MRFLKAGAVLVGKTIMHEFGACVGVRLRVERC